ncbi:MAG: GntR family transcriptional regulator [Bacteroidales bacterium]|nr:GntR family transcriptional regulator [Bacteroidales bacterium]
MKLHIDTSAKDPIYKQIVQQIERAVRERTLPPGQQIESMNELASKEDISRETVKKAYGILVEKGIIIPKQGKGFYAADITSAGRTQVLVIFDKFSVYKQITFNAFAERLSGKAEVTIVNHNQSLDLLEYYLDNYLDNFDYYVVTPHFPLDEASQERARKQIARIPNRKLIMLDRLLPDYPGNYGSVYQDFECDIYGGLCQGFSVRPRADKLRVITLPSSLYGEYIRRGVERFALEYHIPVEYLTSAPEDIRKGDTFLVLNSQLDAGLVDLARKIQAASLVIGKDVQIISYNEYEMNELILGGLTTVSTDFTQMGRLAADMILNRHMEKIHCPFRMNLRKTF